MAWQRFSLVHAPAPCPLCPSACYSGEGTLNYVRQQTYRWTGKHSRPGKAAAIHLHQYKVPISEHRHLEIPLSSHSATAAAAGGGASGYTGWNLMKKALCQTPPIPTH